MSDQFELSTLASTAAAGLARTFVEQALRKWGLPHLLDTAYLVVSELVTNAAAAAPYQMITVRFSRNGGSPLIEVSDPNPDPPVLRAPIVDLDDGNFDDNGGWGLPIVVGLSAACGHRPNPGGGKTVWSRLRP